MEKEKLEKKRKLFEKCVEEVKVTKKGMYYGVIKLEYSEYENSDEVYTARSVTKLTLHKIGQPTKEKAKKDYLALKPNGTVLIKTSTYPIYKKLDLNTFFYMERKYRQENIERDVSNLIVYGTSQEWLLEFRILWQFAIVAEFSSFKLFKNFLGFDFISTKKFISLITIEDRINASIIRLLIEHYYKKTPSILNIIYHDSTYVSEILSMYYELDLEFYIPKGKNALRKIHNGLVFKLNEKDINDFSNEKIDIKTNFFELLTQKDIRFKILDSPRKMFVQGLQQRHCIASYVREMLSYLFITIQYQGKEYDIQIHKEDTSIVQFKGMYNAEVPQKLQQDIENLIKKITHIKIEDPKNVLEYETPTELYQDDLPF